MTNPAGAGLSAVETARLLGLPEPTPEQVAVIEAPLEPLLVVAGAGSGKTETMTARVVHLVANGLVERDRVLGLTFTRWQVAHDVVRTWAEDLETDLAPSTVTDAVLGLAGALAEHLAPPDDVRAFADAW